MAMRGTSLAERETIILKDDPGHPENVAKLPPEQRDSAEAPTKFIVGPLTGNDRIELSDMGGEMTQTAEGISLKKRDFERAYKAVQRGLKGWENFLDEKNNVIPFTTEQQFLHGLPREVASGNSLNRLTKDQILALSNEIMVKNGLKTEMEKKFEGLFSQAATSTSETSDAPKTDAPPTSENVEAAASPAS